LAQAPGSPRPGPVRGGMTKFAPPSRVAGGQQFMTSLSTIKTSPKWSMQGRSGGEGGPLTPGPGAYGTVSPDSTQWNRASRTVFGSSAREDSGRHPPSPGPGQYSPAGGGQTSPKFGFGTSRRQTSRRDMTPGPGAYDAKARLGAEGSKYSVSGKAGEPHGLLTPGPGAYQTANKVQSGKQRTPNWSFGTSARGLGANARGNVTPGPGAYEHKTFVGKGPGASMKARHSIGRHDMTPGPGAHCGAYTQFGY